MTDPSGVLFGIFRCKILIMLQIMHTHTQEQQQQKKKTNQKKKPDPLFGYPQFKLHVISVAFHTF